MVDSIGLVPSVDAMSSTHLSGPIPLSLILIAVSILFGRSLQNCFVKKNTARSGRVADATKVSAQIISSLKAALPSSALLPKDSVDFKLWRSSYHAQQVSEVTPACVVQPCNAAEVSTAIRIIKHEYDARHNEPSTFSGDCSAKGLFAIRSGGHSHVAGAANLEGGIVIDMSLLNEVTPSVDGTSVVIGMGARWGHVFNMLEKRGLAVVGGRASDVGVGGFTLGGKSSLLFPLFRLPVLLTLVSNRRFVFLWPTFRFLLLKRH
jgi:hypothetical protein